MNPEEMINRVVEERLGPAQGAAPPQPPAPPQTPPKETVTEEASTKASPETEGDLSNAEAVIYDIDFGGTKRQLTPKQIAATFERYASLNDKHGKVKPILSLAEQLIEKTGIEPDKLAGFMVQAMKAYQHNPQMGEGAKGTDVKTPPQKSDTPDQDDPYSKWEKENAAQLPPGYREQSQKLEQALSAMEQLQAMMAQVLNASRQNVTGGQAAQGQAAQTQQATFRRSIANNLDAVQSRLGLPDESANDFMTFASERGYTLEDFADPELTMRVMTDFKNNMSSPEMERLRQIAQRRAAVSGSIGSSASANNAPAPVKGPDATFDRLVNKALQNR